MPPRSLYVHIPFCAHICGYCDFAKVLYREEWAFSYARALEEEIASYGEGPYETIYLGGGTPTHLPFDLLERILACCEKRLIPGGEFTIEGNPEDIDEPLLRLCLKHGVNRLSLGVQSSSPRLLSFMGRHHTFDDARKAFSLAKDLGFEELSADMIYALPGESLSEVKEDIAAFLSLSLPHLSAYCLSVSPGSSFFARSVKEADDEEAATQYKAILEAFREKGYERYEVSNFALPGHYSRHNLTYWRDEEYVGVGLGACGYLDGKRYANTKNLTAYLSGKRVENEETLTKESELEDYFLTNLRLARGFDLMSFRQRFGFDFFESYRKAYEKLVAAGLLTAKNGRVFATDSGILLLDRILLELF